MWVSRNIGVCLPTFWVFGWKTNTARVYTGCVPADARTQKQKEGACPCRSSKHIGTGFLVLTKGEHMHNTEYEKYPTSGEENVEVDVHWPIQDA